MKGASGSQTIANSLGDLISQTAQPNDLKGNHDLQDNHRNIIASIAWLACGPSLTSNIAILDAGNSPSIHVSADAL